MVGSILTFVVGLIVVSRLAMFIQRRVERNRPHTNGVLRTAPYFWVAVVIVLCLYFGSDVVSDLTARRMDIYSLAMRQVYSSPAVNNALGAPLRTGWPIKLSADIMGSKGTAELEIPIRGSQGAGVIHVSGQKMNDIWMVDGLDLTPTVSTVKIAVDH
jgi:hypothetical protein